MKFQELSTLIPYCVIKGSSDNTFLTGDVIWLSQNGDINNMNANGWITPSEVEFETLNFETEKAEDFEVVKTNGSEICRRVK